MTPTNKEGVVYSRSAKKHDMIADTSVLLGTMTRNACACTPCKLEVGHGIFTIYE